MLLNDIMRPTCAVMAYLQQYPGNCPERLRKTIKTLYKMLSNPVTSVTY
jgi:hypothetical protein